MRDLDEQMEVVGENAPTHNTDTAKGRVLTQQLTETVTLTFLEVEPTFHNPGDAVVVAGRVIRRGFPTWGSHRVTTLPSVTPITPMEIGRAHV